MLLLPDPLSAFSSAGDWAETLREAEGFLRRGGKKGESEKTKKRNRWSSFGSRSERLFLPRPVPSCPENFSFSLPQGQPRGQARSLCGPSRPGRAIQPRPLPGRPRDRCALTLTLRAPPAARSLPGLLDAAFPVEGFRSPVAQLTGLLSSYREKSPLAPLSPCRF